MLTTIYCIKCGGGMNQKFACNCGLKAFDASLKSDPIVDMVCEKLKSRSTVGIKKYNTTLYENLGDSRYWINHALEEALDMANYLQRLLVEMDKQSDDNK